MLGFIALWFFNKGFTQYPLDSLKNLLNHTVSDSSRITLMLGLSSEYAALNFDSAYYYANKALLISQKTGNRKGIIRSLGSIAARIRITNIVKAVQLELRALKLAEEEKDNTVIAPIKEYLSSIYRIDLADTITAEKFAREAVLLFTQLKDTVSLIRSYTMVAGALTSSFGNLDSADFYLNKAEEFSKKNNNYFLGLIYLYKASVSEKKQNKNKAIQQLHFVLQMPLRYTWHTAAYNRLAQLYQEKERIDSVIYFSRQALLLSLQSKEYKSVIRSCETISNAYQSLYKDSALYYANLASTFKDTLAAINLRTAFTTFLELDENQRNYELSQVKAKNKEQTRLIIIGSAVLMMAIILFFIIRNNRKHKRMNLVLQAQKLEISNSLKILQSTQAQLIQSEKMASLGELTAGIAHEIQNPLNFVNNFSEVSQELIDEMKVELNKGNYTDAEQIAADIKDNLNKIHHHGKRADAIVKGMLQHSRTGTGKKEPVDINALCDEYLRLAYHGMRAKDNSFNTTLVTDFDSTIQTIQIQSQEMGRVILNLINNALYAVGEKQKHFVNNYEPKVTIKTKRKDQLIEISVEDNGMGIPASIKDKIFQPFFTTKPTGQGTGLGLSLSYDIVTKGHSGELRCETKYLSDHTLSSINQSGTTFTILLPDHTS